MEVIKKKICLDNFRDRSYIDPLNICNPYILDESSVGCDKYIYYQDISGYTAYNSFGYITGLTENGDIEHFTPNIEGGIFYSNLLKLDILLTQTIDDIGTYTDFSLIWDSTKTYYIGDIVLHNNISYKCIVDSSTVGAFLTKPLECKTYVNSSNIDYFTELYYLSNTELPSYYEWEIVYDVNETGNTISYLGESKINEFRRYGKTDNDKDLYNPTWNTGFTLDIVDSNGYLNKITNEKINYYNAKQNLYDYIIGASQIDLVNTGLHYQDQQNGSSIISYKTSGLNSDNSITVPNVRLDYLFGISQEPKIDIDIFIDRGENSTFDKNLKLGEIRKLDDLLNYGNGFFKVKNN